MEVLSHHLVPQVLTEPWDVCHIFVCMVYIFCFMVHVHLNEYGIKLIESTWILFMAHKQLMYPDVCLHV